MNWGGILSAVFGQLVTLLIVLAMVGTSSRGFERIVICALVLLYLSVSQSVAGLWRAIAEGDRANLHRFLELKAAVGQERSAQEFEPLKECNEELARHDRVQRVRAIGTWIAAMIALVALVGAL